MRLVLNIHLNQPPDLQIANVMHYSSTVVRTEDKDESHSCACVYRETERWGEKVDTVMQCFYKLLITFTDCIFVTFCTARPNQQ